MFARLSKLSKPARIALIVVVALIALVILAVIAFNIYIRTTYSSFYDQAREEFPIPETNSGFVEQDIDYLEQADAWLFSGYMNKQSTCPILRRDADGRVAKVYVRMPDGELYGKYHGSGITSTSEYVFLTTDSGYVVLSADDVANAKDGDTVQVLGQRELGFAPAFLSISNDILYTGEFYDGGAYDTPEEHHMDTPNGERNSAIMYAFVPDPTGFFGYSELPEFVYSIPNKVQGVCVTEEGSMVLSTSWGLSGSHLLVYSNQLGEQDDAFLVDGTEVPLRYLDSSSLIQDILAPPMTEGVTVVDGRVYVGFESASNKYVFGKLYPGGDMVYSLEVASPLGE